MSHIIGRKTLFLFENFALIMDVSCHMNHVNQVNHVNSRVPNSDDF